MNLLIITNNPRVNIEFCDVEQVQFHENAIQEKILRIARDCSHLGARLVAHPMAGRIKPHETPYKSVLLEERRGETDVNSVIIIEDSIAATRKLLEHTSMQKYDDELLPDLQLIDLLLLKSGLDEVRR